MGKGHGGRRVVVNKGGNGYEGRFQCRVVVVVGCLWGCGYIGKCFVVMGGVG